jgi:hypothetical protein
MAGWVIERLRNERTMERLGEWSRGKRETCPTEGRRSRKFKSPKQGFSGFHSREGATACL